MDYSRRRRSRRSRRGGSALSPALLGGRRSRRSRRGGSLYQLNPAPVSELATMSAGRDPYLSASGIDGAGITNGGVMGQALTAGGYRSRRSRRRR